MCDPATENVIVLNGECKQLLLSAATAEITSFALRPTFPTMLTARVSGFTFRGHTSKCILRNQRVISQRILVHCGCRNKAIYAPAETRRKLTRLNHRRILAR
jgi:hypothetical protein